MWYVRVKYANRDYVVCQINYHSKPLLFVVNASGFQKVKKYKQWNYIGSGYIGHFYYPSKNNRKGRKLMYLHNLVMNKLTHDGKGQQLTIDHINRIGTDNRKENLRLISQSHQNNNQKRKKRKTKLPEDCGFTWDDVPKNVWYVKPTKTHGARFCVEIKTETLKVTWKTTSSKDVSLKFKLEHMKKYLRILRDKYPNKFQKYNICNTVNKKVNKLIRSYNNILKLSDFDCVAAGSGIRPGFVAVRNLNLCLGWPYQFNECRFTGLVIEDHLVLCEGRHRAGTQDQDRPSDEFLHDLFSFLGFPKAFCK